MKITFWILFIGAPLLLLFIFSPPGPAYFVTMLFHYPVWFVLKLVSEFAHRRIELNESIIFFIAIVIGLICTLNFYQMGGDGKPFEEIKVFSKIISSPKSILHSDKYDSSTHENRLLRSAALGKFYEKDLDLDLRLLLADNEFRNVTSFYIHKKGPELNSNLDEFKYNNIDNDFLIEFEIKDQVVEMRLSKIEENRIVDLKSGHFLVNEELYDFDSGLSYFLFYYFKWFHNNS